MNEKKPLIIASAALAVIILAGGGALYYLHFVVLPKAQKELEAAQKAVADAKDKQNKIKPYTDQIAALKIEEEKKKTRIPNLDSKEYDGLANLLDDIRKRAGVDLSGGTYSQPKGTAATPTRAPRAPAGAAGAAAAAAPTAGVHKVHYDMIVKGGFHQLLRYLNLLEKERRFLNVESFTITKGAEAKEAKDGKSATAAIRQLKVTVSSHTYRTPPPPPPTTPTAAVEIDKGGQSTPVPD